MRTTRVGDVPRYLGADLTDRYAKTPRAIDVCGLAPVAGGDVCGEFLDMDVGKRTWSA